MCECLAKFYLVVFAYPTGFTVCSGWKKTARPPAFTAICTRSVYSLRARRGGCHAWLVERAPQLVFTILLVCRRDNIRGVPGSSAMYLVRCTVLTICVRTQGGSVTISALLYVYTAVITIYYCCPRVNAWSAVPLRQTSIPHSGPDIHNTLPSYVCRLRVLLPCTICT